MGTRGGSTRVTPTRPRPSAARGRSKAPHPRPPCRSCVHRHPAHPHRPAPCASRLAHLGTSVVFRAYGV
ncbi:hypothetical protein B4N89_05125 [Embleya scabrispora]|uniref:Uncharacterized protein n=1 Tax=Embleya scabrispora TaxID=159449 RepID=A0A1T3NUD0_9ACTN|nr:hypothetical protein B4N89_05125 [Embleya scabrispora]